MRKLFFLILSIATLSCQSGKNVLPQTDCFEFVSLEVQREDGLILKATVIPPVSEECIRSLKSCPPDYIKHTATKHGVALSSYALTDKKGKPYSGLPF